MVTIWDLDLPGKMCPSPTIDVFSALGRLSPGQRVVVLSNRLTACTTLREHAERLGCTWRVTEHDGTIFRIEVTTAGG